MVLELVHSYTLHLFLSSLHIRHGHYGLLVFVGEVQYLGDAVGIGRHLSADVWVCPFGARGGTVEQSEQVFPEVLPHKAVEDGVDTAGDIT